MWHLLYDSPARRDIYSKETMCDIWLLSFCGTRWVEGGPVTERAIEILPNIVTIIKYWQSLCKSKRPQNNKSYNTLVHHHTSSLIVVKLPFFKYIASIFTVFLVSFQSDNPMLPFLCCARRLIITLFVRRDVNKMK